MGINAVAVTWHCISLLSFLIQSFSLFLLLVRLHPTPQLTLRSLPVHRVCYLRSHCQKHKQKSVPNITLQHTLARVRSPRLKTENVETGLQSWSIRTSVTLWTHLKWLFWLVISLSVLHFYAIITGDVLLGCPSYNQQRCIPVVQTTDKKTEYQPSRWTTDGSYGWLTAWLIFRHVY